MCIRDRYGRLEDTKEEICADIDSARVSSMNLHEMDEVYFQVPKGGMIAYPASGC